MKLQGPCCSGTLVAMPSGSQTSSKLVLVHQAEAKPRAPPLCTSSVQTRVKAFPAISGLASLLNTNQYSCLFSKINLNYRKEKSLLQSWLTAFSNPGCILVTSVFFHCLSKYNSGIWQIWYNKQAILQRAPREGSYAEHVHF